MGNATTSAFASYGDDEKVADQEANPFRIQMVTPQYILDEIIWGSEGCYKIYRFNLIFEVNFRNTKDDHFCVLEFDQRFSELAKFHQKLKANDTLKRIMNKNHINFPSKISFDVDKRCSLLCDYLKLLGMQQEIINHKVFQHFVGFDITNPSIAQQLRVDGYSITTKHANNLEEQLISKSKEAKTSNESDDSKVDSSVASGSNNCNMSSNSTYKLSYKINNICESATENKKITRMWCERDMFLCILNSESSKYSVKSLFGHKCIAIAYPTDLRPEKFVQTPQEYIRKNFLSFRLFMIELFIDPKKERPILSLNGPLYHTRNYRCEKLYCVHADVLSLLKIANEVMDDFGDYQYLTNNCQTFVKQLIEEVKKSLVVHDDGCRQIKWEHVEDMMQMCFKETTRTKIDNCSVKTGPINTQCMSFNEMIYQFKEHKDFDRLQKLGQLKGDWSVVKIGKYASIDLQVSD